MHRQQQNNMQHTELTQFSHNPHKQTKQYAAHTREQRTTHRPDTEHSTEQHTENRTQDTTICSAHNYRTYSFDYYNEYAVIKNSNTIELYTISND